MTQGPVWSRFRLDPRSHTGLRASDEDRDIVRELVGDAFADGRLDRSEFDERLGAINESRFLGDLVEALSDLLVDAHPIDPTSEPEVAPPPPAALEPLEPPPPSTRTEIESAARAHHAKALRASMSSFVGASAITTLIWFATGLFSGGFIGFWPIFVILGTGIGVISTAARRSQIIDERRRTLTRQAREYRELYGPHQDPHPPGRFSLPGSHAQDRRELRRRRSQADDAQTHEPTDNDTPPDDPSAER